MIVLRVGDNKTVIEGADKPTIKLLDQRTSYRVEGFQFSSGFRNRSWDGKVHTLRYSATYGLRLYTGLVPVVTQYLRNLGHEVVVHDERRGFTRRFTVGWYSDMELRDYQKDVIEDALSESVTLPGRGMLSMAVRSGKTVTAAGLIHRTGARTLFIVNQERQLTQTVKLFRSIFKRDRVGQVGGGQRQLGRPVTVAMVQTLFRRRKTAEIRELMKSVDMLFVDECHHLRSAETWKRLVLMCDAYYKFGLSATIYLSHKKDDNKKGAVWLHALTGPLLKTVSTRTLIGRGVLVPATIRFIRVNGPEVAGSDWHLLKREGIIDHRQRNKLAALTAAKRLRRGRRVLVIAHEIRHMNNLEEELSKAGVESDQIARVEGKTSPGRRDDLIGDFTSGRKPLLLGNVFKEAVDIPAIEDVIVCEGGKDRKAAIQRLRNLTPGRGKARRVYLYDFADMHNRILAAHSASRLAAYRAEGCFDFGVVDHRKRRRPRRA